MRFGSEEHAVTATALTVVASNSCAFLDFEGAAAVRLAANYAVFANQAVAKVNGDSRFAEWAAAHKRDADDALARLRGADHRAAFAWSVSRCNDDSFQLCEVLAFVRIARFEALHAGLWASGDVREMWKACEASLVQRSRQLTACVERRRSHSCAALAPVSFLLQSSVPGPTIPSEPAPILEFACEVI